MRTKLIILFLFLHTLSCFASRVDTVLVISESMNKSIPNIVIIPDSYSTHAKNFSVLYLLHGAGGDYTTWLTRVPQIKEYADTYNIIIVCPDGGYTSWYFDSPIDKQMNYETYISKELIVAIDNRYKTSSKKNDRAISGQSMGGHGAFYLAFRHQDVYGAAGSMSGGMDIRPFPNDWDIAKRLGEYSQNRTLWTKNSVVNMVYMLKRGDLKLIFDCGYDDFFYDVNKKLHESMLKNNIQHDYIERPGSHNWDYWSNAIQYQVLFFHNYFNP